MGCLGVHFAFTDAEVAALRKLRSQKKRVEYLEEELEEKYFEQHKE
jgi:hypothetical protein